MMEISQWANSDLYNGRIVKIANRFVFKEPVFNYSGDFPFLWDEITVPVKYGSDYRLAREIFQRILLDITGEYTQQTKASWSSLIQQYRVDQTAGRIVLTSATFHLVEAPEIKVQLMEPPQGRKA